MYEIEDQAVVRELIDQNGWALLVSSVDGRPVVSHLPVLLDREAGGLALRSHLAAPDAELHQLGDHEAVVVVQGPHGYVSASFYEAGPYVSTWNFMVVHLHGRPEVLGPADSFKVLSDTVDHYEKARPHPFSLAKVPEYASAIAPGATGFRLVPDRVVAKAKLSQDKAPELIERVVKALDTDPVDANPALAEAMRRFSL